MVKSSFLFMTNIATAKVALLHDGDNLFEVALITQVKATVQLYKYKRRKKSIVCNLPSTYIDKFAAHADNSVCIQ